MPDLPVSLANRRPRIALVTLTVVDRYAVPKIVAHLLRRISDEFDLVVISRDLPDDLRARVDWRRVRIPAWLPFRLAYPFFLVLASWSLRRAGADLSHTFGSHPLVLQPVDLATVQFSHSAHYAVSPDQDSLIVRMLATAVERWSYRPGRVRALAAPSAGAARELERDFPGVEVVVVPNGVDTDRFKPSVATRQAVREREGVSAQSVVAIFVGRHWHGKGVEIAIEAIAEASTEARDLSLWVVGNQGATAAQLADRLGLSERIRFFGQRQDVERYLQAADIFLFPSLSETFGLACFEAAAAGLPIVATAVNGAEELLADGDAGFVVARTPTAFAGALRTLAGDPKLRARMGIAARRRAMRFSWDHAADELRRCYRRLLEERAASADVLVTSPQSTP